jgi:hypothetical protein
VDFFDYAWSTSFQITRKKHEEVKILLQDNVLFPTLKTDSHGYVICLAKPKMTSEGKIRYQGTTSTGNDEFAKKIIWRNFKASVFHLSMHAAISNFETYAKWAKDKNPDLAVYVVSLLEDAKINAYLKVLWTPFLYDIAFANTFSYLKLKAPSSLPDNASKVMASILSKFSVGLYKENMPEKMQTDIEKICLMLQEIENQVSQKLHSENKEEKRTSKDVPTFDEMNLADEIYNRLSEYGEALQIPSLFYTEKHGNNMVFYDAHTPTKEEVEKILPHALSALHIQAKDNAQIWEYDNAEFSQIFPTWEARENMEQKTLGNYQALLSSVNFTSFEYPNEDLAEYMRCRNLLSSSIRRILELLRGIKNIRGEDYRLESGLVDLQEAIQVIASKSQRSDIFTRDELQSREEAWAILIDASHSLNFFTGEVRGIALCLSEVAKGLFFDAQAWSMFAFNDKFYIIKDFSESFTNRVRARIGGLKHGGLTYLPDGLMLAAEALKKCREESRVLVVVSDFFPSGYGNVEEEFKEKVKKVERSGIGLIGIGVNSNAVRNYFRISCVVEDPFELMKKFVKAFLEYSSTAT